VLSGLGSDACLFMGSVACIPSSEGRTLTRLSTTLPPKREDAPPRPSRSTSRPTGPVSDSLVSGHTPTRNPLKQGAGSIS
jgi:hypothetical protein